MSFTDLQLGKALKTALANERYKQAYPIQKEAIPAILNNKDILGIAPTGSGKTASYVLPILEKVQAQETSKNRHASVLVLVPTRELAIQVQTVFQLFSKHLPTSIKTLAVYGGVAINPQMIALQGVEILVATPGRLIDLINNNAIHLSHIKTLVLDEADKMLNLGFRDELDKILALMPQKRQNLLFSATLSDNLNEIHQVVLHQAVVIKIEAKDSEATLINQVAYQIDETKKGPLLRYIIKSKDLKQVLVFVSSVYKADTVSNKLRVNGIDAVALHGGKSQSARNKTLARFKSGELRVLVATDLLSRGIDIQQLDCVINYELPRSPKDYLHRIGRTGRAGCAGEAYSLISPEDQHHFKVIQKKMKRWVDRIDGHKLNLHGY